MHYLLRSLFLSRSQRRSNVRLTYQYLYLLPELVGDGDHVGLGLMEQVVPLSVQSVSNLRSLIRVIHSGLHFSLRGLPRIVGRRSRRRQ